jgi:uncharacterized protein (TIGR03437 family)
MPSYLGGYQLLFDGVAAPLLYIGANQINAIVPSEAAGQDSVSITLVTPAGTFPLADLYIRPSEPGIFCDPTSLYAAAINQDGTVNSATNPAHAGQLVSIWGTGAGGTALYGELPSNGEPGLPVSIIAGYELAEGEYAAGESLEVDYAGNAPGEFAGVLQINFRIPQTLTSKVASSGSLYVSLQVGAAGSLFVPIHVAP